MSVMYKNIQTIRINSRKNKFLSNFIAVLFNSSGIPLHDQTYRKFISFFKYYLLISFTLLTSTQIILLKDCKKSHEFTITLAYIVNGVFFNITTLVSHFKTDNIINIVNISNDEISIIMNQPDHKNVETGDTKFRKFFFSYGITYFIIYTFSVMAPFLFLPISGNKIGDSNTLLIPSWFPWEMDSMFIYLLTIGLQFSWLFPLSVPVLLNFTFVVYFVIEVRIQFDILCRDISNLKDRTKIKRYDQDMSLKKCIQHYQVILRFVKNFCTYYSVVFMADLVYSLANLSLLLYGIILGEKTVSAIIQQMSSFVVVLSLLYLYCFIGEVLSTTNEQLRESLYDTDWFKQSMRFQKTFLAFLRTIQKPPNLKAGKDNIASFSLFSSVVKLAYSYFNIMTKAFNR